MKKPTFSYFTQLSRTCVYTSPWLNLYVDKVRLPEGRIVDTHHVIEFTKESVAAIVENDQGEVLCILSYRYPIGGVHWEIPAGRIEEGESMLLASQREVFEETGYQTKEHRLFYSFYPINGISNKTFHIVWCKACTQTGVFDGNEVKEVKWFSKKALFQMIDHNEIKDGYSLTALLLYFRK